MPVNHEVTSENYYRYRYAAERSHYDFIAKADKCEKFFKGDQWAPADIATLTLQRRPALTINKINSTIATVQGVPIVVTEQSVGAAHAVQRVLAATAPQHIDPAIAGEIVCVSGA